MIPASDTVRPAPHWWGSLSLTKMTFPVSHSCSHVIIWLAKPVVLYPLILKIWISGKVGGLPKTLFLESHDPLVPPPTTLFQPLDDRFGLWLSPCWSQDPLLKDLEAQDLLVLRDQHSGIRPKETMCQIPALWVIKGVLTTTSQARDHRGRNSVLKSCKPHPPPQLPVHGPLLPSSGCWVNCTASIFLVWRWGNGRSFFPTD
jgi:hypothetical protein